MRFLLVDEIRDLRPGEYIEAVKTLSPDEELFKDHFPGFPVVPGVLLTEMMAQAAGKCLDAGHPSRGKAMLAQIRGASFREWVPPGKTATILCSITSNLDKVATASCEVKVEGRRVCSADLLFAFLPTDRLASGYRDEVLERYLASRL